jgi:hypothetical protein
MKQMKTVKYNDSKAETMKKVLLTMSGDDISVIMGVRETCI